MTRTWRNIPRRPTPACQKGACGTRGCLRAFTLCLSPRAEVLHSPGTLAAQPAGRKSEFTVPQAWALARARFLAATATSRPRPHVVETKRAPSSSSSYKDANPIPRLHPVTSQCPLQTPLCWGPGLPRVNVGVTTGLHRCLWIAGSPSGVGGASLGKSNLWNPGSVWKC